MKKLDKLLRCLLTAAAVSITWTGSAQGTFRVSGQVTDSSQAAIPGVMVVPEGGTGEATVTGVDGNYTIEVPRNGVLTFSMIGYTTQSVPVSGRARVDVLMTEQATQMDDVIVVGYGTQRRGFLVGSVSQVSAEELNVAPATNVSNLLTGRLPGITSIQRSGQPGNDQTSLLVRGITTFNDSSPLTLVDGVERQINMVNPNDIETITILKDAATSAIYGVRGANGVVLITTKRGTEGKTSITYNGSAIFSTNTAMPEMLNAKDYIGWHNAARVMDGLDPVYTEDHIQTMKNNGIYGETDWLNEFMKSYGFEHQHNISATGGSDKFKYFASIGLTDRDGIIPNTSYRRINIRSAIDARVAKNLSLSMNLHGYRQQTHSPGYDMSVQSEFSPISAAMFAIPIVATTYTEPDTGMTYPLGYRNSTYTQNPNAYVNESGFDDRTNWQFEGDAKLEYDFGSIDVLKGLRASMFASYNYGVTGQRTYMNSYEIYSYGQGDTVPRKVSADGINVANSFTKSTSFGETFLLRPTINYDREFGRHSVSAILFYEQSEVHNDTMTGSRNGYYSAYPIDISIGSTSEGVIRPVSGSFSDTGVKGYAGRFNYAFDRKYLAEVTFRTDSSYKFPPEHRWGFFPSVALGWVASEEDFFKDWNSPVTFLKFRGSYGEGGKDDLSPFTYMQMYETTSPNASYIFGGGERSAYYTTGYVYKDLTWSRTRSYNVGLNAELWGGKLGIEFDWFYKLTTGILQKVGDSYAPSLGGNVPTFKNSGAVDNRGFELILKHRNRFDNGISYSLTGSVAYSRNRLISSENNIDNHPWYRASLGHPLGELYGFRAIGLYQTQEDIDSTPTAPSGQKRLGDIMYADINGDGKIDSTGDFVKIGSGYTPRFNFSLDMNVDYKGFYLSALWQGVAAVNYQLTAAYGSGVFDNTMYTRPFYGNGNAPYYLVEDSWREDNTDAGYPRLSSVSNGNNAWPSSWWVKNGAYLRLKTLTVGYQVPQSFLKGTGIGALTVSLAARNLLTISAFKYVDPEMPSVNNGYYPQQKTYSVGLDLSF